MQLLVVNFHYIRDVKPSQGIYPRSLNEFIYQLEELGRCYQFISQQELIKIVETKKYPNGNYCLITFDDNLKEQMNAYEYLENKSIPALFFSTTLPYLNKTVHHVHKLHHIFSVYSDEEITEILRKNNDFDNVIFDQDVLDKEYRYDSEIKKKIKFFLNFHLSNKERNVFINYLFNESVETNECYIKNLYMNEKNLKLLASKNMLGSHTHSHMPLATLSKQKIIDEIKTTSDFFLNLTGKTLHSISFPFGGPGSIDDVVIGISKNLGMKVGFSMNRGINYNKNLKAPLILNRVDTNDAPGGKLGSLEYYR